MAITRPPLGFGAGLRAEHYADVVAGLGRPGRRRIEWFEVISENFMDTGGRPLAILERVRADHEIALHGVGMSIGEAGRVPARYLERLRRLVERIEPALVTDHLCWTGIGATRLHDLLPIPYTAETLAYLTDKVRYVQDALGRQIALENPSRYLDCAASRMPEWEFLARLSEDADCGILLDVNNVYVSAHNLGFDPLQYLEALPVARVVQVHLAGFTDMGSFLFDTHSAPVHDAVWALYAAATERLGTVAAMVEWDAEIPAFARLGAEVDKARAIATRATDAATPPRTERPAPGAAPDGAAHP